MSQKCERCNQVNSDWATECGRCGRSFLVEQKLHPALCVLIMLTGAGAFWFMVYLLFSYFNGI